MSAVTRGGLATERPRPRSGGESQVQYTPDRVQCEGCGRIIGIARPADIPFAVVRELKSGRHTIAITIGLIVVHRCTLCADGEWR